MTRAARIVGELRGVAVGVGDREQVVFGIVVLLRGVTDRVGDGRQAVGVVVGVGPPFVSICTITNEGAPSLRTFCKGGYLERMRTLEPRDEATDETIQ